MDGLLKILNYRKEVDKIDKEIVKYLFKRKQVVKKIFEIKDKVYDPIREKEILNLITQDAIKLGLNKEFVKEIFLRILKDSKDHSK